jgi:hypothetical protein
VEGINDSAHQWLDSRLEEEKKNRVAMNCCVFFSICFPKDIECLLFLCFFVSLYVVGFQTLSCVRFVVVDNNKVQGGEKKGVFTREKKRGRENKKESV